jgi:hypothetical protein
LPTAADAAVFNSQGRGADSASCCKKTSPFARQARLFISARTFLRPHFPTNVYSALKCPLFNNVLSQSSVNISGNKLDFKEENRKFPYGINKSQKRSTFCHLTKIPKIQRLRAVKIM